MALSDRINKNSQEKIGYGDKTNDLVIELSRNAVEVYSNTPLLYFEVDVENSRRNFYGEMLIKKFKQPLGVKLYGTVKLTEDSKNMLEDIPYKLVKMNVGIYTEHLREQGVWPQLGDYFCIKNRFYFIEDKEILDVNKHTITVDREAYSLTFICSEADDEIIMPSISAEDEGYANQLLTRQNFSPPI